MEQGYCLSAESLLYAVLKLHKRGIYGVPNVMPKSSDKQFPEFAQQAEMELLNKGYGLMDFDGVFSLEDCFAELVSRCADCTGVIGTSLRRNGKWEKYTLYLDAGVLLCSFHHHRVHDKTYGHDRHPDGSIRFHRRP